MNDRLYVKNSNSGLQLHLIILDKRTRIIQVLQFILMIGEHSIHIVYLLNLTKIEVRHPPYSNHTNNDILIILKYLRYILNVYLAFSLCVNLNINGKEQVIRIRHKTLLRLCFASMEDDANIITALCIVEISITLLKREKELNLSHT